MSATIHQTAVIHQGARLGLNVEIGPYCTLGSEVEIGDGCRLHSHVVVTGVTRLGAGCEVWPFAVLGSAPQDLKYRGEPSRLVIGAGTRIREHVTMNTGTEGGGLETRVGGGGLFMVGVHVAHDCQIGDGVIMANNATLAGHVEIGDHAVLGGLCAVHQFVKIGAYAMIGGMTGVEQDVIPYGLVQGERGTLHGLNLVGLNRRGFSKDAVRALQEAVGVLFDDRRDTLAQRLAEVDARAAGDPAVGELVRFVRERSKRGLCAPARSPVPGDLT